MDDVEVHTLFLRRQVIELTRNEFDRRIPQHELTCVTSVWRSGVLAMAVAKNQSDDRCVRQARGNGVSE